MELTHILCIDLRRYDYNLLEMFSAYTDLNGDLLVQAKRDGIALLFLDEKERATIGFTLKNHENSILRSYKGLVLCDGYTQLTKKEKDQLLKMNATLIDVKALKKEQITSESILSVDMVLEKIFECGINSLNRFEKAILENETNRLRNITN
jgi:hypothetical protein